MNERAPAFQESRVPRWLWWATVGLFASVLIAGLGVVIALSLGWRSLTPHRAPDLNSAELTWIDYGDGSAALTKYGYRIHLSRPGQNAWAIADPPVDDFDAQLDIRSLSSNEDVGVGLVFRYQNRDNFYLFLIGNDGYYFIGVVCDGDLTSLRAWQQWPHVRTDDDVNRLRAHCEGSLCRFFINGEFTAEIVDDNFLKGNLGLWAQNFSNDDLDVVFESIQLWLLD